MSRFNPVLREKVIVITFLKELYWAEGSKYNKLISKFITEQLSPDTVNGQVQITMTSYERLQSFVDSVAEFGQPDPDPTNAVPSTFVEFIKKLVNDGVVFLFDYAPIQKRGLNTYYSFDIVAQIPDADLSELVPVGIKNSEGTGEEGDAEAGQQRTWQQYITFNQSLFEHNGFTYIGFNFNKFSVQGDLTSLVNSDLSLLSAKELAPLQAAYNESLQN